MPALESSQLDALTDVTQVTTDLRHRTERVVGASHDFLDGVHWQVHEPHPETTEHSCKGELCSDVREVNNKQSVDLCGSPEPDVFLISVIVNLIVITDQ